MYCCVRKAIIEALANAESHGNQIKLIVLKTDRPTSEYWNSGMIQALRDLSMEFQINISHFTEQSHHNKVTI